MAQVNANAQAADAPIGEIDRHGPGEARRAARRGWLRRGLLGAVAVISIAAAAEFGVQYWQVGRFMVSTDDAYLQADSTAIAPRVSGYIDAVLVGDNQPVKVGQVLARIDDRDFRTALRQVQADRESAETGVASIDAQLTLQQSAIAEAASQVDGAKAALTFATQDQARYRALAHSGAASTQEAQQSASLLLQRTAALHQAQAALTAAQQQVAVLKAARGKAKAQLDHAMAAEQQARLNLGYTVITAPIAGVVGARALRVGQFVQAGTQLMAVVPLHAVYVVANYKETQLTDVHAGQPVQLSVDTFPGMTVSGHVDSLAPATGLEFALLPPDNATGNFTKIVQRIPVRISLDPDVLAQGILRPGMSVEPVIDTRPAAMAAEAHRRAHAIKAASANTGAVS